jgi:hypothetical protein
MTDFAIKKLPYDLSSHAGLAFIGKYLKRVNVNALIDPKFPVRSGVANSEILTRIQGKRQSGPFLISAKVQSTVEFHPELTPILFS